jgi:hypothetical protein
LKIKKEIQNKINEIKKVSLEAAAVLLEWLENE